MTAYTRDVLFMVIHFALFQAGATILAFVVLGNWPALWSVPGGFACGWAVARLRARFKGRGW